MLGLEGGVEDNGYIGGFGLEFGVGGKSVEFLHLHIQRSRSVNVV